MFHQDNEESLIYSSLKMEGNVFFLITTAQQDFLIYILLVNRNIKEM